MNIFEAGMPTVNEAISHWAGIMKEDSAYRDSVKRSTFEDRRCELMRQIALLLSEPPPDSVSSPEMRDE